MAKDALGHGSDAHGAGIQSRVSRVKGWGGAIAAQARAGASQAKAAMKDTSSGGKPMMPSAHFTHSVMARLHEPDIVDYGDTFSTLSHLLHKLF